MNHEVLMRSIKKINRFANKRIVFLLFAVFCLGIGMSQAQYKVIYNMGDTGHAGYANGAFSRGQLTLIGNKLFGATAYGGSNNQGVLYSIDTNGSGYKDLLDFDLTNGGFPWGKLTIIGNVIYGTTSGGGTHDSGCIFSIDTSGQNYRDLFNFNKSSGCIPYCKLIYAKNKFFGMTTKGGSSNCGTVFSIDTNGANFQVLLNFNGTNGQFPYGSLALSGGYLFGMTYMGGANSLGSIFTLDTNGGGYKDLYDFSFVSGANPYGDLTLSGSKMYGTTYSGALWGSGDVFSIDTSGSGFKDIYDFNGSDSSSGYGNTGSLALSGGVLYGTTEYRLGHDSGIIFRIDTDGAHYEDLHNFMGKYGGVCSYNTLTVNGNQLFGVTDLGGTSNACNAGCGVIFKFTDTTSTILTLTQKVYQCPKNISVFPNPSNGVFTLQVTDEERGMKNIEVYNVLGEKVFSQLSICKSKFSIDLFSQPNGIYFYRVVSENGGLVGEGKVVVQK